MNPHLAERYKDPALIVVLTVIGIGGFALINLGETEIYEGPGGLSWRSSPFIYSGILLVLVAIFAASTIFDVVLMRKGRSPRTFLGDIKPTSSDQLTTLRRIAAFVMILVYAWALGAFGLRSQHRFSCL